MTVNRDVDNIDISRNTHQLHLLNEHKSSGILFHLHNNRNQLSKLEDGRWRLSLKHFIKQLEGIVDLGGSRSIFKLQNSLIEMISSVITKAKKCCAVHLATILIEYEDQDETFF
ncbi:hypothetical protein Hanom_Chr07g00676431 [Helianthus anomalus]